VAVLKIASTDKGLPVPSPKGVAAGDDTNAVRAAIRAAELLGDNVTYVAETAGGVAITLPSIRPVDRTSRLRQGTECLVTWEVGDTYLLRGRERQRQRTPACSRTHRAAEATGRWGACKPIVHLLHCPLYGLRRHRRSDRSRAGMALRMESLERYGFLAAAELADESVMITDADLDAPGPRIRYVNKAFERLTGRPREEVIGATPRVLQGPDTDRAVLDRMRKRLAEGEAFEGNVVNYRRDGTPFVMQWRVRALHDEAGALVGYVSVQFAVGEHVADAAHDENLHGQIFSQHTLPMFLLDPKTGAIIDANQGAERFYGYTRAQMRRMHATELTDDLSESEARAEMQRTQSERSHYMVMHHRLANGESRLVEIYSSPITMRGHDYLHSLVHDITERDRLAEQVQWRLYYDPVTELPNRASFNDRLAQAMRMNDASAATGTAVLRIDIDRFRQVNQLVGQERGDQVLRLVGERLQAELRPQDTLARTSSDEFSIIMPYVWHREGVAQLAQRVNAAVREPISIGDRRMYLTASIATCMTPRDGQTPSELAESADATMLLLKRGGGDTWGMHEAEHSHRTGDRVRLAEELREALNAEQLRLAWQPTVRIDDGAPAGGEMLVRWLHPQHGWVRPDRLIAAAEESGQIIALGEWVLRHAADVMMRAGAHWARPVAVNVSLLQLRSPAFATSVRHILAETGLPASALELELTESAFADEGEVLTERLQELRAAGVSVAIDDFGTGYSSLQYLRRLPFDRIKIDRSFISGIDTDADNRALVATIVDLASHFGLALTAEGIERQAEQDTLRQLGVCKGQGYYFGRPAIVVPRPDHSGLVPTG